MVTTKKLSKAQQEALQLVREGRVEFGSEWPQRDRRQASKGRKPLVQCWVIDGFPVYGQKYRPFQWLEEHGLIVVRHDLVPTHMVPEWTYDFVSVAGVKKVEVIPAHEEPVDPGWRAPVEVVGEEV